MGEDLSYADLWDEILTEYSHRVEDKTVRVSCKNDETTSEFGDELWPGAIFLAKYIVANNQNLAINSNTQVVEIGAGRCGLPGLTAAALGARVTLCDLNENLASLHFNAKVNPGSARVQALRWAADIDVQGLENADFVLGTDVVYRENLVAPLICTLRRLRPKRLILANEERSKNQRRFAQTLSAVGFHINNEFTQNKIHVIDAIPAESWSMDFDASMPVKLLRHTSSVDQDSHGGDGLGGQVWPGAVALAEFVLPYCHGKRVLELGAGTGYCGLCVSLVANHVIMTDQFLDLLAHNVAKSNFSNVTIRYCLWNDDYIYDKTDFFDVILGAELTPMIDGHEALAKEILRRFMQSSKTSSSSRAFLTAAPCSSSLSSSDSSTFTKDTITCRCATHHFIKTAIQTGLSVNHCHTNIPIPANILNLDRTFDDGLDFVWILELGLSLSFSLEQNA
mmetsp:Transcript_8888/g.13649  ORF Transcript_8888/g.13649 Transcript_8888/m.13649 type:complete len:451 (-) Transcript_8888:198-1550(-)|eukprot:CAMPEP_0197305758 /NCGR_PEP_ID=MMETSP0891-20130614/2119_1 /TAXON_ID=44058 ORGANISM="Aureoumbra lagunensis, Strain CCMP1510" /NCGR_SAMPLE_ID=MMETSP0891 /ASSEMBLY_ACC=CAM_ASM_000534 /LENGTH=450 /DNA_ID=CAMNT_0042787211 /DNA_START=3490 /DNA_END=4845 /DNA_ORIENTATION=+